MEIFNSCVLCFVALVFLSTIAHIVEGLLQSKRRLNRQINSINGSEDLNVPEEIGAVMPSTNTIVGSDIEIPGELFTMLNIPVTTPMQEIISTYNAFNDKWNPNNFINDPDKYFEAKKIISQINTAYKIASLKGVTMSLIVCSECKKQISDKASSCPHCGFPIESYSKHSICKLGPTDDPYISSSYSYSGFWKRVLASLVDAVITGIAGAIIGFVMGIAFSAIGISSDITVGFNLIAGVILGWLYYALMESSPNQATLGKSVLGIKVTDINYSRISFSSATGRYFGKGISGLLLCIGYIMVAFTSKKQGLHDIMAGTLVVNK